VKYRGGLPMWQPARSSSQASVHKVRRGPDRLSGGPDASLTPCWARARSDVQGNHANWLACPMTLRSTRRTHPVGSPIRDRFYYAMITGGNQSTDARRISAQHVGVQNGRILDSRGALSSRCRVYTTGAPSDYMSMLRNNAHGCPWRVN